MNKSYPLHHEDARPMYVNIPIEEYKRTAKKLLDAAAVIIEKDKEIEKLKNAQRWRKVSEELPEDDRWVLCITKEGHMVTSPLLFRKAKEKFKVENVFTHWMPLPEPPEVK